MSGLAALKDFLRFLVSMMRGMIKIPTDESLNSFYIVVHRPVHPCDRDRNWQDREKRNV
jgi:hypothetical protein